MCGIAGIMLSERGPIGPDLIEMLDGCQHRGPDSTGFALYKEPNRDSLVCRVYLAVLETSPKANELAREIFDIVESFGGKVLQNCFEYDNLRFELQYSDDIQKLSYAIENNVDVEIFSIGSSLEIVKGIGTAHQVDDNYNISKFYGTHGIGHVRLAKVPSFTSIPRKTLRHLAKISSSITSFSYDAVKSNSIRPAAS